MTPTDADSTALVVRDHGEVTAPPSPLEWQALREQADVIAKSGLAPSSVDTYEKVLTISLKGRELRVPPMQALSHIHVIEGKPTLSAELMRSLVRRAGHRIRIIESDRERCTVQGVRTDDPDYPLTVTWTMEMAEAAQITGKGNWRKHPDAMLIARATSALCRALFDDVLMGASYTPEELGADVDPETGEVLTVEVEHAYRDPAHTAALGDLEQAIAEAHDASVEFDEPKAREYGALSAEHARSATRNLWKRIHGDLEPSDDPESAYDVVEVTGDAEPAQDDGDVVDAEVVEDDEGSPPADPGEGDSTAAPSSQGSRAFDPFYDWHDHADQVEVTKVELLTTLRDAWPPDDTARQPKSSKDIDALAMEDSTQFVVRETIDDIAESR